MNNEFTTTHKILVGDSRKIKLDKKIDLIITSPPYPMIKMWDKTFKFMNNKIDLNIPDKAFKLMHNELRKVYVNGYRQLNNGGIMVINIGDAYRKIKNKFKTYHNIAKTIENCVEIGFDYLPSIHWFKPTNAPNKFMGSGTLPIGAYVTSETEKILIFRKGIRKYTQEEIITRKKSSIFHHERNIWFSNIWKNVLGAKQKIEGLNRARNGAFPVELPLRIISMYSILGDVVWDPFGGTGTTSLASIILGRNSYLNDIDESFIKHALKMIKNSNNLNLNLWNLNRIKNNKNADKNLKYKSKYGPVKSKQERNIEIFLVTSKNIKKNTIVVNHKLK